MHPFPTAPGSRLGRGLDRPRGINDPGGIPMRAIHHVGALENLGTVGSLSALLLQAERPLAVFSYTTADPPEHPPPLHAAPFVSHWVHISPAFEPTPLGRSNPSPTLEQVVAKQKLICACLSVVVITLTLQRVQGGGRCSCCCRVQAMVARSCARSGGIRLRRLDDGVNSL